GDLMSAQPGMPDGVLFELACLEEGWFYFTTARSAPDGHSRVAVSQVLDGLGPQVEEWRDLTVLLPPNTLVKMSTSTPSAEVQIRADQWQLLSLVGGGRTVRQVVDASAVHPLDTLRILGELLTARLITIDEHAESAPTNTFGAPLAAPLVMTPPSGITGAATETEPQLPLEGDSETREFRTGGPLPPFVPPPPSSIPPVPEGWVATEQSNGLAGDDDAQDPTTEAPSWSSGTSNPGGSSPGGSTVMPPPISGDPWSSALSTEPQEEDG
ncbi:MAG TPA: hypothetical protein VKG43_02555, partial [Acidimicrobiales bacterium]|nr:hypothetical protein [Acidimicrobiales bacterium]